MKSQHWKSPHISRKQTEWIIFFWNTASVHKTNTIRLSFAVMCHIPHEGYSLIPGHQHNRWDCLWHSSRWCRYITGRWHEQTRLQMFQYLTTQQYSCLHNSTRKLCYRKDDRAMRPIHAITWVPWKFSGLPDYAHGYYSQHFMAFCSDWLYECSYKIWSP